MTLMTEFNQRAADHDARISRINQQGWMWEAPRSTGVAPIRQRIGGAIVRVGEQLRGAPTGHVADRGGLLASGRRPFATSPELEGRP